MGFFVDWVVLPLAKLYRGLAAHDRPSMQELEGRSFHTVLKGKPTGNTKLPDKRRHRQKNKGKTS